MARTLRISATHAVGVVEAAYDLARDESAWIGGVLDAALPDIDCSRGAYSFTCAAFGPSITVGPAYVARGLDDRFQERVVELNRTAPDAINRMLARTSVICGGLAQVLGPHNPIIDHFRGIMAPVAIFDAFSLFAQDGEGRGVVLSAMAAGAVHLDPRTIAAWNRVGTHVASALRLRRRLADALAPRDALLTPAGVVVDVQGKAHARRPLRDELAEAVKRIERARSSAVRSDPAEALMLWQGLVAGEWSLVDHWESDGRRYVAAYRNRPELRDPRGLTSAERMVLPYAAKGASNKAIAFALGRPIGSVSAAVARVQRKLRCKSRGDLALFAATMRRAEVLRAEGLDVDVLAVDARLGSAGLTALTTAERAVAELVIGGFSPREIARTRRTSLHTVTNQLRAVYGKLGVASRPELVRTLLGGDA